MSKADIGLIGLAVMGQNLVLNMEDHGFSVAVYNRTLSRVDEFMAGGAQGRQIIGTHSLAELSAALKRPRRVMLMVCQKSMLESELASSVPRQSLECHPPRVGSKCGCGVG